MPRSRLSKFGRELEPDLLAAGVEGSTGAVAMAVDSAAESAVTVVGVLTLYHG